MLEPGRLPGREVTRGEGFVGHRLGVAQVPLLETGPGEQPAQRADPGRIAVGGQGGAGGPLGLRRAAGPQQGTDELVPQHRAAPVAGREVGHRAGEQVGGEDGGPGDQRVGGPYQPVQHGGVDAVAGQEVLRHPFHLGAVGRQRPPGLKVQRGTGGRRHVLGQGVADHVVAERELVPRVGQQAGGDRLPYHGEQRRRRPFQHHRQLGQLQRRPEYRGHLEHVPGLPGQEVQPAHDHAGQRLRYLAPAPAVVPGGAVQLGHAAGDTDPALPQEGGDQLGDVHGVAGGTGDQVEQVGARRRPRQPFHQAGDGGGGQRAERDRGGVAGGQAAQQALQLLVTRYRPVRHHDQQR